MEPAPLVIRLSKAACCSLATPTRTCSSPGGRYQGWRHRAGWGKQPSNAPAPTEACPSQVLRGCIVSTSSVPGLELCVGSLPTPPSQQGLQGVLPQMQVSL